MLRSRPDGAVFGLSTACRRSLLVKLNWGSEMKRGGAPRRGRPVGARPKARWPTTPGVREPLVVGDAVRTSGLLFLTKVRLHASSPPSAVGGTRGVRTPRR